MRRLTLAALPAALLALTPLVGCDDPAEVDPDPPIVIVPDDMALETDAEVPVDAAVDAAPPDAAPDMGPLCSNPCDDGDPGTTRDRCVDDVCVGDPLPSMLVLAGDLPREGEPAASAIAVTLGDDGPVAEPLPWRVPRGRVTGAWHDVWITRTLPEVGRTVVLRAGPDGFAEIARTPAVPDARVIPIAGERFVLAGDQPGAVPHVGDDGAVTPLGVGLADDRAFIGRDGDALIARSLRPALGEPWVVDPATSAGLDAGQVLLGMGLLPRDDGLLVVDVEGQRTATVPISGPLHGGDGWMVPHSGSALLRVEPWPPVVEEQPIEWIDARAVANGVLALDAEGAVWWIGLDPSAAAPVQRGVLPADAAIIGDFPGGVAAANAEGLWWIGWDAEPTPLPLPAGTLAGALGDTWLLFVAPERVAAVHIVTGEVRGVDGAFGTVVGDDGPEGWIIRGPDPAPMRLGRLDRDGLTPLSEVWSPEARILTDDVEWVRIGGDTAAFIAEADGPLMTLDLSDPAAEPIAAARLRVGERWSIGGVSADGRWVVWRAGDAVLGSLRGAPTDGSGFPDGVELLRSRAYVPLMAPVGARMAMALEPRPTGGFPILDPDREDPAEATWVVSEGLGLFPLAWIDGDSLIVGLCAAEGDALDTCAAWGIGRVDLIGDMPVVAPLAGPGQNLLRPVWGRTAQVAGDQLYVVRSAGLARFQVRRIPLDGRGNWTTVAEGPAPVRLVGAADGGMVFEMAGTLQHADALDGAVELALPGPVAGFGPLEFDRPLTLLAETTAVALPDGSGPCFECRAFRVPRDGDPIPLGDEALRPLAWSPAGDVLVHGRLLDGHLAPALTDDAAGPLLPLPAVPDDDVRILRWSE